jgi:hypothetical protein
MRRLVWIACLPLVAVAVGCSNRPLAGLMDNLFPSRGGSRSPRDLPRPTDRDPIPPPVFDPTPPDDGFRRDPIFPRDPAPRGGGGLPRIGDPVAPDGRRPSEAEVPFVPRGGAMPLPGGGGY